MKFQWDSRSANLSTVRLTARESWAIRSSKASLLPGHRADFSRRDLWPAKACHRISVRTRAGRRSRAGAGLIRAATEPRHIPDLELEPNLFPSAQSDRAALGAGLVVYAEGRDMAAEAVNSIEFFRMNRAVKCALPSWLAKSWRLLGHTF